MQAAKKQQKVFARMLLRKEERHARVKHLPLSRRFGKLEELEHAEFLRHQKALGAADTGARPDLHLLKGNPELFADPAVPKVRHSVNDDFRQLKASNLV
ncbi:hypothetical protein PRNP1_003679 [Phytophthora ramorum]